MGCAYRLKEGGTVVGSIGVTVSCFMVSVFKICDQTLVEKFQNLNLNFLFFPNSAFQPCFQHRGFPEHNVNRTY